MLSFLITFVLSSMMVPMQGLPAPPGTIMVNDSVFIDMHMVSVEAYEEFLLFLKHHSKASSLGIKYQDCVPDSNIHYRNKPYLSTKKYSNQWPILNLSFSQIEAYCKWRSYVVSLMKNNPDERTCNFEQWEILDKSDPLHRYEIQYLLLDSSLLKAPYLEKQLDVAEICKGGLTDKQVQNKHFKSQNVYGFRCLATYILR